MNQDTAIEKIKTKIAEIDSLTNKERFCPDFKKWRRETIVLLKKIFGNDSYQVSDFTSLNFVYRGRRVSGDTTPFEKKYRSSLKDAAAILTSIYEEIEEFGLEPSGVANFIPMNSVERILKHFHSIAKQLRQRHSNRETLDIKDEYDVQDLLHSLLRIFFSDIRPEEWTPSYAGNAARMDFLLHQEEIVIETKMTRKGLSQKEVVDQLIIDIARYQEHPRCKLLVCFVYDPDGYIGNSAAIICDLEKQAGDLKVRIFVHPANN